MLASGQVQLGYCSVSERLARQVQHLLLRFGGSASLRSRSVSTATGGAMRGSSTSRAPESIRTFADEIGIFGKEDALARCVRALQDRAAHANRDVIPPAVWDRLDAARDGASWSSVGRRAGFSDVSNLHVGQRGLSRDRLRAFADALHDRALAALATSDVYWDEVTAIEFVGVRQVYDLTVPNTRRLRRERRVRARRLGGAEHHRRRRAGDAAAGAVLLARNAARRARQPSLVRRGARRPVAAPLEPAHAGQTSNVAPRAPRTSSTTCRSTSTTPAT